MKKSINKSEFRSEFTNYNRSKNFSYEGLGALFDFLEELEESTGTDQELDVIALCCDFTEYENLEELQQNYNDIETLEDLENNTTVIKVDDERFIIQNY
ncbi:MAG TPA: hypothetical protein VMV36_01550 [Ignavibacteriaceae bacterium]|nr:hypothetical protein [Ignavibacteriaceae bacterium]